MGELDAPLFYEALRKVIVSDITSEVAATIEVEGEIVENQLVLDLPEDLGAIELMRDIAILVGDRRIIVKWKEGSIYPTAH